MTDVELLDLFLYYLKQIKKISDNTYSAYKSDIGSFISYLSSINKSVVSASDNDICLFKDILVNQGKSVSTVSRCMSSLRTFYKYLFSKKLISSNPSLVVKNDKPDKKQMEILSEKEIDLLISQPDTSDFKGIRDRAMLEMLYATGMKVTELMSLNVSDVNIKMNFVNVRGSDARKCRIILLYPECVRILEQYIVNARSYFVSSATEEALFVNVSGERMTRQGFWKLLKSYSESAKIKKTITPHTLRHSFATHLLENGADIQDIRQILGHTDISSTQVYVDYIKEKVSRSYIKFNHRSGSVK